MADGSVTFVTELDNKRLEGQLQKLKKDIAKIEQSVAGAETEKSPLVQQAQELEQSIKMARAEAQKYRSEWRAGVVGADSNQSKAIERASQLESQYAEVVAQIEKIDKKLIPAYTRMDKLKEEAGGLEQRLAQAGGNAEAMGEASRKAEKHMSSFSLRLKEVVRSALVFTVISQALAKFRGWAGKVIRTNDKAAASVARLNGALLTLAQPLVGVLIPAFTVFVNILTAVVSVLANITSMVFGTTVDASAKAAESLNNETSALDGIGSAAKKAGKSLASFDEINKLAGDTGSSGCGGGGGTGIQPDFSEFQTALYKQKLDEITAYVSGALLALGAILAFSGANIPLGIGLMAVGAVGLVAVAATNWDAMPNLLRNALSTVFLMLGPMLFIFGLIFALSGAHIALGIGLMIAGASSMGTAVALNWTAMSSNISAAITAVMFVMGSALLVLGALFAFSGVNVGLGIGLMLAGAVVLGSAVALNWGECSDRTRSVVSELMAILGTALLVFGALFAFSGASLPLGIGLMLAGAVALGSEAALNWDTVRTALENPIARVTAFVSGALLVLGIILAASGVALPLGIALIAAGAGGLVSVGALDWDAILKKLKDTWSSIKNWWNTDAAKYFTADYWIGIGKNMLDGLFNGLSSIGSKISEWGGGFIDGVKDFFGIHSPSTEFETLGKYMMLGMEGGIDDNNEVVLAVFSGLLAQMLTMTQTTTDDMQALFAAILLYIMADFKSGWTSFWQYFQDASGQSIQSVMGKIDALNAKLASIERNITITITTAHKTVGNSSGFSSSSAARSVAARVAAMPTALKAIPMATGGVIPPNREFLALYGDQRSGNNIEAPESLLRKIVREEAGGNAQTLALLRAILEAIREGKVLMMDRDVFAKLVYGANKSESNRVGPSLTVR